MVITKEKYQENRNKIEDKDNRKWKMIIVVKSIYRF